MSNGELASRIDGFVGEERQVLCGFLEHLGELERRRLHLELGFSSVFSYLTEHHGMSKGSAFRRLCAARLARRVPEVLPLLRSGKLSLVTLCLLRDVLRPSNAAEVLERAAGRTEEQVKVLVAALCPRTPPKPGLRKLPRHGAGPVVGAEAAGSSLEPLAADPQGVCPKLRAESVAAEPQGARPEPQGATAAAPDGRTEADSRDADAPAHGARTPQARSAPLAAGAAPVPRATLDPVAEQLFSLRVTLDAGFMAELEEARALLGHQVPSGELGQVLRQCVRIAVRVQRQRRHGAKRPPSEQPDKPECGAARPAEEAREADACGAARDPGATPPSGPVNSPAREGPSGGGPQRARHIPVEVRRAVWARDEGRCTFVAPNGQRCSETRRLEFHHEQAFARGGAHTVSNIRIVCFGHHALLGERELGAEFLAQFRGAAPPAGAVPTRLESGGRALKGRRLSGHGPRLGRDTAREALDS